MKPMARTPVKVSVTQLEISALCPVCKIGRMSPTANPSRRVCDVCGQVYTVEK